MLLHNMSRHIMYCTVIVIADWSNDKRFSDHFSAFIAWDLLKLQQIHWDHDLFPSFLCVFCVSLGYYRHFYTENFSYKIIQAAAEAIFFLVLTVIILFYGFLIRFWQDWTWKINSVWNWYLKDSWGFYSEDICKIEYYHPRSLCP